jgi:hypothetical protein
MPNKIKPKRSYTANAVPTTSDLDANELAINWADGKAYTKNAAGNIVSVTLGGGGGTDAGLRALFVPPAPTGLTAVAGNASATLSWTAPTGVIAQAPITDYREQYSTDGGTTWTTFTAAASTATTATVTGLTNGQSVRFRVAGINTLGVGAYTAASAAVTPGIPSDNLFASVSLLLHMNGTGNTFVDSSGTPKSITAVGSVTQSATQSKFGGKAAYFDGDGDWLDIPLSSALQFGTGDFTIEWWMYLISRDENGTSVFNNYTFFGSGALALFCGHVAADATKYQIACDGSFPAIESSSNITYNRWDHFAIVRSGSTLTLYINGTSSGSASVAGVTLNGVGSTFSIGSAQDARTAYEMNGYIDEFRVTKAARYTANFTPQTAAFPDS